MLTQNEAEGSSSGSIYPIEKWTECLLDRLATNVAFCRCSGQSFGGHDEDELRVNDSFVHVPARMEVMSALQDLLLELCLIPCHGGFDEESW
jgi:hypothetical protein